MSHDVETAITSVNKNTFSLPPQIRVTLSTGLGRLHLVQSATYISHKGVSITLIQGWVPSNAKSLIVRLVTYVTGHKNLAAGLEKRRPQAFGGRIRTCAFAEFATNIMLIACKWLPLMSRDEIARLGWLLFGWQSARHLRSPAHLFHVRSGAGQGGAIKAARKYGMAVLVDQSSLHPDDIALYTDEEYRRWGLSPVVQSNKGIWPLVLKDCSTADFILVNSEQIKASFVSRGFDPERIWVAYLGVRDDFFGIKSKYSHDGPLRLLFTGGFSPLKGAHYLLEAIAILERRQLNVQLDVVGSTEMARAIIDAYAPKALPVNFHGHVPQDKLKEYLAAADVYVFPSLADGCASSGMEAMAAGLCVVATPQSGLPIRDGQTGFLVEKMNAIAIADCVEKINRDRSIIETIGRNACAYMRDNHTWDKYATRTIEAYHACISLSNLRRSNVTLPATDAARCGAG